MQWWLVSELNWKSHTSKHRKDLKCLLQGFSPKRAEEIIHTNIISRSGVMNLGPNNCMLPQNGKDICLGVYEYNRFLQLITEVQKMKGLYNILFTPCMVTFTQTLDSWKYTEICISYSSIVVHLPEPSPAFWLCLNLQDKYRDIWNDLCYIMNFRADFGRTFRYGFGQAV